jgi:hypothetical protein
MRISALQCSADSIYFSQGSPCTAPVIGSMKTVGLAGVAAGRFGGMRPHHQHQQPAMSTAAAAAASAVPQPSVKLGSTKGLLSCAHRGSPASQPKPIERMAPHLHSWPLTRSLAHSLARMAACVHVTQ